MLTRHFIYRSHNYLKALYFKLINVYIYFYYYLGAFNGRIIYVLMCLVIDSVRQGSWLTVKVQHVRVFV